MSDWTNDMFPGNAGVIPDDDERNRADAVIEKFSTQWGEEYSLIARQHDDGKPTNRAFMRSALRRWWAKK